MKMKLLSLFLPLVLAACAAPVPTTPEPVTPAAKAEVWVIASKYKDCTGVGPMKCMYVTKPNGKQEFFYGSIQGFNYQEGYEYQVEVASAPVANPPADGSSIRYTLVKIISQKQVQ